MMTRDRFVVESELQAAQLTMPRGTRVRPTTGNPNHRGTVTWHWAACDAGTVNALVAWDHLPLDRDGLRGAHYVRWGSVVPAGD
jgi:hypothetical protein